MKLDKLVNIDIVTGVVFGLLIGLYHPVADYKTILLFMAGVLGLKVVGVLK